PYYVPPSGITSINEMNRWHDSRDGQWLEAAPPDSHFSNTWLLRQKQLVEDYRPDLVYFDDAGIPFGETGLEAVSQYYNKSIEWHGDVDVVLFAKRLSAFERSLVVEDVERGFVDQIRSAPWQTD